MPATTSSFIPLSQTLQYTDLLTKEELVPDKHLHHVDTLPVTQFSSIISESCESANNSFSFDGDTNKVDNNY